MSGEPELRTSRLLLRPWRDDDREPFAALNADPVVMEHFPAPYATEGARAALEFGFDTLALDEIVSFTTHRNSRSRRVMEPLGMHRDPDDDFDNPNVPIGDPIRPHVLYRLARTSWRG